MAQFSDLVGRTMVSVVNEYDERVVFTDTLGKQWALNHQQDCCEYVFLSEVHGDLGDLAGHPILTAEEVLSDDEPEDGRIAGESVDDREEWTFYKLSTIKGSVTLLWYDSSNGYYSTDVSFAEVLP